MNQIIISIVMMAFIGCSAPTISVLVRPGKTDYSESSVIVDNKYYHIMQRYSIDSLNSRLQHKQYNELLVCSINDSIYYADSGKIKSDSLFSESDVYKIALPLDSIKLITIFPYSRVTQTARLSAYAALYTSIFWAGREIIIGSWDSEKSIKSILIAGGVGAGIGVIASIVNRGGEIILITNKNNIAP